MPVPCRSVGSGVQEAGPEVSSRIAGAARVSALGSEASLSCLLILSGAGEPTGMRAPGSVWPPAGVLV